MNLRHLEVLLMFIVVATAQGCAMFVSHYDATAYQYFTSLKAYHIKLIEDFKSDDKKIFSAPKVQAACDTGDLKFREAREYAGGRHDVTRVRAIQYLYNVFDQNCALLLRGKKLFGETFAAEQISELKKNYDLAIAGEAARVGVPAK